MQRAGDETVWRAFGKHGKAMRTLAAGIDDRPVEPNREEKSISAEETFAIDIQEAAELERQLTHLADRTATRLRAHALAAGKVIVKIRRRDFTTYTRQRTVEPPTQLPWKTVNLKSRAAWSAPSWNNLDTISISFSVNVSGRS